MKEVPAEKKFSLSKTKVNWQVASGVALGVSLLAGAGYFLHPFVSESSYAANTNVAVTYNSEDWTISAPTSTAADAGGLTFDIEGNPAGVNMAKKDTVTSGSTNVPDYQIYVSVNTEGGKISATSGDAAIDATSGTVTDKSNVSGAAALSTNSWGYALSNFNTNIDYNDLVSDSKSSSWSSSKWSKLPYVATSNLTNDSAVEGTAAKIYDSKTDTTGSVDIYYGINANNDLASGEYQTTVTYTLIGAMPAPTELADGLKMQEVTPDTCANTDTYANTGKTYELVDSRDQTPYYIRKFDFGGTKYCTMVENLNLAGGTTVTYKDTNITNSTTTYLPGSGSTATGTYTLPASTTSGYTNSDTTNASQKMYNGYGRNRDGATGGNSHAVDGAYYQWQVATAGTGGPYGDSRDSAGDICPKNWHLPTINEIAAIREAINNTYSIGNWFTNSNGTAAAASAPVYSGFIGNSTFNDTYYGYWWSTSQYHGNVMVIYAYPRIINPGSDPIGTLETNNSDKYFGYSVRCLLSSS